METKEQAGIRAAEYIEDGMVVGLGTGSTAYYFVKELGRRVKEEGLTVTGVTTSSGTRQLAESVGIPLKTVDEVEKIDITVDGADEISARFQGIKGGGGALLFEKIVALQSEKVIWIVDEKKMCEKLGKFPLPLEVIEYGSRHLLRQLESKGYQPVIRTHEDGSLYRTDEHNLIIDLHLETIEDPASLADELDHLTGVVEHGLFLDMVSTILVGTRDGVQIVEVK